MELIRSDINIDFVGAWFKAIVLSLIVIVAGVASLIWHGGLNLGVDFAGGTLIQLRFTQATSPGEIRNALADIGLGSVAVQQVGQGADSEYIVRTEASHSEMKNFGTQIEQQLSKAYGEGKAQVRRVEMVGPKIGRDLREKALLAVYYSLLFMAIYISGRFELKWAVSGIMAGVLLVGVYLLDLFGAPISYLIVGALLITFVLCWVLKLPYALGAIVALVHDVVITVGVFSLLGKEFTLEIVAALLTIVGYSVNDTIIVFDRIRENLRKDRREGMAEVVNRSVNQTLSRTLLTAGTTLLVVICLFLFGGSVIHDFAFALLIGILVGTYSSIFIASPILILYENLVRSRGRRPVAVKNARPA